MAPGRTSRQAGFTLLELMAVVLIMGTVLALVPLSLDSVGSEGKLRNSANSFVAAVNGARDRAILDGYEVYLEVGAFRSKVDDEYYFGWRFKFTNVPPPEVATTDDEAELDRMRAARAREREWLFSNWHQLSSGMEIVGVSTQKGSWTKVGEGGRPVPIRFFADGTIEGGVAVRLRNKDMEVSDEYRTVTVLVNGLTSEASWSAGMQELPEALPSSNFGN